MRLLILTLFLHSLSISIFDNDYLKSLAENVDLSILPVQNDAPNLFMAVKLEKNTPEILLNKNAFRHDFGVRLEIYAKDKDGKIKSLGAGSTMSFTTNNIKTAFEKYSNGSTISIPEITKSLIYNINKQITQKSVSIDDVSRIEISVYFTDIFDVPTEYKNDTFLFYSRKAVIDIDSLKVLMANFAKDDQSIWGAPKVHEHLVPNA